MGKKNENINLWLLEEERRKDRERTLTQAGDSAEVQVLSDADEPSRGEENPAEESKLLSLSKEAIGFERLDKEKEALEEESQRLDREIEKLSLKAKALSQKMIQEMERNNKEKRKAVSQLQEEISRLEAQLTTPSTHNSPEQ